MSPTSEPQPAQVEPPPWATVGRHTYGYTADTFKIFMVGSRIEVGAFCSIGPDVRILAGSEHLTDRASTFPLKALLFDPEGGNAEDAYDKGVTTIGHDVWIGLGAVVLSGVLVGHGAVLGAGAVVSRPVPPYAVVAGNPARIVRYRFEPDVRRRLLALGWWSWNDAQITELKSWFMGAVGEFLAEAERRHPPGGEDALTRRLASLAPAQLTPDREPGHGQAEPGSIPG